MDRVIEVKPSVERKLSEFLGMSTRTIGLKPEESDEVRRLDGGSYICFHRGISKEGVYEGRAAMPSNLEKVVD